MPTIARHSARARRHCLATRGAGQTAAAAAHDRELRGGEGGLRSADRAERVHGALLRADDEPRDEQPHRRSRRRWRRAAASRPRGRTHRRAHREARWSPDGKRIAYIAGDQLWVADQVGGARKQLTTLAGGATGPVWSPSGDRIAFTSRVFPTCSDDACNVTRQKAIDSNPVKAHVADELMYRHWNAWDDGTRAHLFVVGADGNGLLDLTPGATYDVPPGPFGGSEGYAWAPDGKELAYTAKDAGREDAWSTDNNLYTVPSTGGKSVVITAANKGADENPVYSPDGKLILYHSQARAGFESDRWRLMSYDRSSARVARAAAAVGSQRRQLRSSPPTATACSSRPSTHRARNSIAPPSRTASRARRCSCSPSATTRRPSLDHAGRTIAWLQDAADRPSEVFVATLGAGVSGLHQLSHENDALVAQLKVYPVEDYWFKGANGDSVQGMILRPPQWAAGKEVSRRAAHSRRAAGPWLDQWHGRWNYQMFAAQGYGIVIINPRGSPGYGQKFVDAISKDWGGEVYTDLMNGLDAALAKTWLDGTRWVQRAARTAATWWTGSPATATASRRSSVTRARTISRTCTARRRSSGSPPGNTAARTGTRRRCSRTIASGRRISSRRTSRRRRSSPAVSSTIACRTRKISRSSARCSDRAFRPGSWSFPTKGTGCRSRRTRSSGGAKCRGGWASICSRRPCSAREPIALLRGRLPTLSIEIAPRASGVAVSCSSSREEVGDALHVVGSGAGGVRVRLRKQRGQESELGYATDAAAHRDDARRDAERDHSDRLAARSARTTRRSCSSPSTRRGAAVPAVYGELGIQPDARRLEAARLRKRGRELSPQARLDAHVALLRLRHRPPASPNADDYDLLIRVITQIIPADGGLSSVRTQAEATGHAKATSGQVVRCASTGALEEQIAHMVSDQAVRAAAK